MNRIRLVMLSIALWPLTGALADQLYCPAHSGYINTGMSEAQVVAACGKPLAKQSPSVPVTQRVQVKQLIYTALNQGSVYPGLNSAFYTQWSLPSGTTGIGLTIEVVNDKVVNVSVNGDSTKAMSLCGQSSIQAGTPLSQVYSACGSPMMMNNTYVDQVIPSKAKPEVWMYQINSYGAPVSLTFANGTLQSIH